MGIEIIEIKIKMATSALLVLAVCCLYGVLAGHGIGTPCTSDTECSVDECCQILSEFQIVSRRDTQLSKVPRSGICARYLRQGELCNRFDKANGYCSCSPQQSCLPPPPPAPPELITRPPTDAPSKRQLRKGFPSSCQ